MMMMELDDGEGDALQAAILQEKVQELSHQLLSRSRSDVAAPIDEEGTTLLHLAANTRNPRILGLLLDKGVSVNATNGDGFTALHVAAMWGRENSLRELLIRGADPIVYDNEDMTALDYANNGGHTRCSTLLRQWMKQSSQQNDENDPLSPNTPHIGSTRPCASSYLATSCLHFPDCSPTDVSIAESFVSMYLSITATQPSLPDLTEVTELSNLTESASLLDILTPKCDTPLPPPHTSPQQQDDHHVLQRQRKSFCVPQLDLEEEMVEEEEEEEEVVVEEEEERERNPSFNDHSLLTLELKLNEGIAHDSSQDDCFTTAVESSPVSPPSCPSLSSSVPFLAESLRKIRLRRERMRDQRSTATRNLSPSSQNTQDFNPLQSLPASFSLSPTPPSANSQLSSSPRPQKPHPPSPSRNASGTDSTHHTSLIAGPEYGEDSRTTIPADVQRLSNEELRKALQERGEQPGPVTDTTRSAYLLYLSKIMSGVQPAGNSGYKGFKYELALVLNGTSPIPDFGSLEQEIFQRYRSSRLPCSPLRTLPSLTSSAFPLPMTLAKTPPTSPRAKRDWSTKTHFNYLLLDPSGLIFTGPLEEKESLEQFRKFVEAVFYVGKGKNARSLQHLKDARDSSTLPQLKISKKLLRILSVWESGHGVVSLHVFHNTTAEEAFCREACMIDAIGLDILTNIQKGHVHGDMERWSLSKRRQFGVFLLHKAFLSYNLDPPQPVGPNDL